MKCIKFYSTLLFVQLFAVFSVVAQHPVEIQQAHASGAHIKSLATAYQMPRKRDTVESAIAVGKSAWALGLADESRMWFQRALSLPAISKEQKADVYFSLSVVSFAGHALEEARLYADRAIEASEDAPLFRSQSYLLLGDIFMKQKKYTQAEREYMLALRHASESMSDEVHFRLGTLNAQIGNNEQAEMMLLKLPLESARLPEALRILAQIAVSDGDYARARTILMQGRERFPQNFLDSWVEYVFIKAAVADKNRELVDRIRKEALKQYPQSDPWIVLIDAEAESFLWSGALVMQTGVGMR